MNTMDEKKFREYLAGVVAGHGAHISFGQAVAGFPEEKIAARVPHIDHTAWQLVYHTAAALWDIINYIDYTDYEPKPYPGGYWPQSDGPDSIAEWYEKIGSIEAGIKTLQEMLCDPERDIFAPLSHSAEHSIVRQAITAADHHSYHIGQLVDLRMLLEARVKDW